MFRITGLDPASYQPLFALSEAEHAARGIVRMRIDAPHVAPCRISLADALPGEDVLLLSYVHQGADTPYRQQGPIFVRADAERAVYKDAMPPALARRTLSLRGFDARHMMIEADLSEGEAAPDLIRRFFDNADVAYIHAHYARRGCFAALIERA